jgi:hypothetical protein
MRITLALLICVALAGCGGGGDEETAAPKPAATPAAADEEAAVREMFDSYQTALKERDFPAACERMAPETTAKLQENIQRLGVKNPPKECPEILEAIYGAADQAPEQKKLLEEIVDTATLDKIKVTGDAAVIDWHATVQGTRTPVSQSARKVDGEWKLVDVTN